jgi:hypothetical protein
MGRGDRKIVRWAKDRERKKKERDGRRKKEHSSAKKS